MGKRGVKREKGALRAAQADSSSRDSSEEAVQARQRWQLSYLAHTCHMPHAACTPSWLLTNPLPPPLPSALLINCCIYVSGLRCDNLRQSCCAAGSSANRSAKEHVEQ